MSVSVTFTVAGPEAQRFKDMIRERATTEGVSMSEYITQALAEYLRTHHA